MRDQGDRVTRVASVDLCQPATGPVIEIRVDAPDPDVDAGLRVAQLPNGVVLGTGRGEAVLAWAGGDLAIVVVIGVGVTLPAFEDIERVLEVEATDAEADRMVLERASEARGGDGVAASGSLFRHTPLL